MRKYIFIIRGYNDIDHFIPLLDYLLNKKKSIVYLYSSIHPVRLYPNENLEYLNKTYNVEVKYLLEGVDKGFVFRKLEFYFYKFIMFFKNKVNTKLIQVIVNKIGAFGIISINNSYKKNGDSWAKELISKVNPNAVIYDWTNPVKFPYGSVTKICKANKIPIIAFPHGMHTNTPDTDPRGMNSLIKKKIIDWTDKGLNFDYFISHGKNETSIRKQLGVDPSTLVELGSLRFSKEWIVKKKKIDHLMSYNDNLCNGIKLVLFLTKIDYNTNEISLLNLIKAILGNKDICLVIKPQTRSMGTTFLRGFVDKVDIAYNTPSTVLSKWCDIAIVWGSSIGIQVLCENKDILHPKYIHSNSSIYEEYLPESIVDSDQHLLSLINKKITNKDFNIIQKEHRNNFLKQVVYGGSEPNSTNIIHKYDNFLSSL
jgi:hypothetical protein